MNKDRYLLNGLMKKGADDIVIQHSAGNEFQLKFAKNRLQTSMQWMSEGIEVFAAFGKRLVTTSMKRFDTASMDRTINTLSKLSSVLPETSEYQGLAKGPFSYPLIQDGYDTTLETYDEQVGQIMGEVLKEKESLQKSGVMEWGSGENRIVTSEGIDIKEKETDIYFSLRASSPNRGSGHMVGCSRVLKRFDIERISSTAAQFANLSGNPKKATPGKFQVLFSPFAFANIMFSTAHTLSAFDVDASMSPFGEAIGKQVASPLLNMTDWGSMANGFGSSLCDEEGRPTGKTTLIDKGVLKTYLHNTSTAVKFNQKPTGNAGIISPHPTNVVVGAGSKTEEELISEIDEGYYMTNLWYTRFNNYSTGDFSTIPRDAVFYVKKGEIQHAVEGMRISENLIGLLKRITHLGKEIHPIKGWEVETPVYTPAALVDDVTVTKSS